MFTKNKMEKIDPLFPPVVSAQYITSSSPHLPALPHLPAQASPSADQAGGVPGHVAADVGALS